MAFAWKAVKGFSVSMVLLVPMRSVPPLWTVPPWLLFAEPPPPLLQATPTFRLGHCRL